MEAYGPFGLRILQDVRHGIAYNSRSESLEHGHKEEFAPPGFLELNELYDTAELRGHKVTGFITSEGGGCLYTIQLTFTMHLQGA